MNVTLRIPLAWVRKADALAKVKSEDGLKLTRADAFRLALAAGFEAVEGEKRNGKQERG